MKNATITKYMSKVTDIEEIGRHRVYHVGTSFTIEATTCEHDLKSRYDLMNQWKKAGFIVQKLPTHISITSYYTDENGQCWGRYNIMHKKSEDGKRSVVNFDYLREATPENERELVAECIRLAVKDKAIILKGEAE